MTPNLSDKKRYILHNQNLKLYTSLGIEIVKIHHVLQFRKSAWMKPFIEFNSEKRKIALSSFDQDFYIREFNISSSEEVSTIPSSLPPSMIEYSTGANL